MSNANIQLPISAMHHQTNVWSTPKTYQISAPIPCCGHPSSTVTSLLVFLTEVLIAALSRGLIDRKFITCRKHIKLETSEETTSYLNIKIYGNLEKRGKKYEFYFTSALMPSLAKTSAAWDQITR